MIDETTISQYLTTNGIKYIEMFNYLENLVSIVIAAMAESLMYLV
jgi:hypothetical protein